MENYSIKLLGPEDLRLTLDHFERQTQENGKGDTPVYMPATPGYFEKQGDKFKELWTTPIGGGKWKRNWGAWSNGMIIGNLQMDGNDKEGHRVLLSMAVEAAHRGKGLGKAFMDMGLAWAKENNFDWVDLGVFANNGPAISLYRKYGFKEVGRVINKYRLFGKSFDHISMTIKISR